MNDLLTGFLLTFLTGLLWSFAGGCYKKTLWNILFSKKSRQNFTGGLTLILAGIICYFLADAKILTF